MPVRKFITALLVPALFLLPGCLQPIEGWGDEKTDGYIPVYGSPEVMEITFHVPRSVRNPGKIYRYGNFLLVNEIQKGIHVYDNTNPGDPQAVGFLNIFGNTDMAIKDDILYADHSGNVVAIALNTFQDLTVKGSIPLKNWDLGLPPPRGAHFECVDPTRGLVIQWKKVLNQNFDCYAFQ